jgi:hypothetical protein
MSAMCSTAIRRADLSKRWGRRLSDPEVPTNLALRSVKGAGIAIALVSVQGVIAQEFVDASLVGGGIGDADTGIVGVGLCWWNAQECECYGGCRRHAHYCLLHQFFLSGPLIAALLSPPTMRRMRSVTLMGFPAWFM